MTSQHQQSQSHDRTIGYFGMAKTFVTHIAETLLKLLQEIQVQDLAVKLQTLNLEDEKIQATLRDRLVASLIISQNFTDLNQNLRKCFKLLLSPDCFQSEELHVYEKQLFYNVSESLIPATLLEENENTIEAEDHNQLHLALTEILAYLKPQDPVAALIIDTENINYELTEPVEKFLADLCPYPIRIRIAVGNWKNLGKQDSLFHSRNFNLIHVPLGQNSADLKISSLTSSIYLAHPNLKAAIICSSDGDIQHLCTDLSVNLEQVLLVKKDRERQTIICVDLATREEKTFVDPNQKLTLATLVKILRELLLSWQLESGHTWMELGALEAMLWEKTGLTVKDMTDQPIAIILGLNSMFVLYEDLATGKTYFTLFDGHQAHSIIEPRSQINTLDPIPANNNGHQAPDAELKAQILEIYQNLQSESTDSDGYIALSALSSEFSRIHQKGMSATVKELGIAKTAISFLKESGLFKFKEIKKNQWSVCQK